MTQVVERLIDAFSDRAVVEASIPYAELVVTTSATTLESVAPHGADVALSHWRAQLEAAGATIGKALLLCRPTEAGNHIQARLEFVTDGPASSNGALENTAFDGLLPTPDRKRCRIVGRKISLQKAEG